MRFNGRSSERTTPGKLPPFFRHVRQSATASPCQAHTRLHSAHTQPSLNTHMSCSHTLTRAQGMAAFQSTPRRAPSFTETSSPRPPSLLISQVSLASSAASSFDHDNGADMDGMFEVIDNNRIHRSTSPPNTATTRRSRRVSYLDIIHETLHILDHAVDG